MYLRQEDGTDSFNQKHQVLQIAQDSTQQGLPILFYFFYPFSIFHMMLNHNAVTLDMILMSANKCFISVRCRDFVTEY